MAALAPDARERGDPFSDYRARFEVRTRRCCSLVVVRSHPVAAEAILVQAYRLTYLDERRDLHDLEAACYAADRVFRQSQRRKPNEPVGDRRTRSRLEPGA